MMQLRIKTKQGAAAFYIVAISTLILTIIAISFIGIITSEVIRTRNSDLSNSAYDSALAGVEDAYLAITDYQSCLNQGAKMTTPDNNGTVTCGEIIYYMQQNQNNNPDCDMVAKILGRAIDPENGVLIEERKTKSGTMQQYYTCTTIKTNLDSYSVALSSGSGSELVPLSFAGEASNVKSLRISWYSDNNGLTYNFSNSYGFGSFKTALATPPTISVQLIQASTEFYLSQFDKTINNATDRGTLFLVANAGATGNGHQYINRGTNRFYDVTNNNTITLSDKQNFATSNDKTASNVPILVGCDKENGANYACSVSVELPQPVGGSRSNDTFMLLLSMPYGGVNTEVSIEACVSQTVCQETIAGGGNGANKASFRGYQYEIDSTGRASDLYRRVKTVVNGQNIYYMHPNYTVELLGTGTSLTKNIIMSQELNF